MSTKAQTKANRQNAQKSTGPRTAEGKAAVSQNAVKHGLFAAEVVITGENPADYEAYHDQFLAELAPYGMIETMLAERIVSLAWRLQRAERMQNQAIEEFIECDVTNPSARSSRERHCYNEGFQQGDPRFDLDHLALGRIATSDWSNSRVLDRMLMYERRIDNSLQKSIHNLKKYQLMRHIQVADAKKPKPAPAFPEAFGFEAATQSIEKQYDLKKQSQFTQPLIGAMPLMKGDYDNIQVHGIEESKPNQSQLQTRETLEGDQSIHRSGKIQG